MKRQVVLGAALGAVLILAATGLGRAEDEKQPAGHQDPQPTGKMTFTIRGRGAPDPAQAGAAAAAARQAEEDAAALAGQAQGEKAREQARQRSQEALRQQDRPLRDFGALTGPLSPTVPTGIRR